jgi:hypothetical protein
MIYSGFCKKCHRLIGLGNTEYANNFVNLLGGDEDWDRHMKKCWGEKYFNDNDWTAMEKVKRINYN